MSKHKKNDKKVDKTTNHINLIAALANLLAALILLYDKIHS